MTQKSLSDLPEDEWWVLWRFDDYDDIRWEAEGPFYSRIVAEEEADSFGKGYEIRVVHSVFTS